MIRSPLLPLAAAVAMAASAVAGPDAHVVLRGASLSSLELVRVPLSGAPNVVLSGFQLISMGLSGWASHRTLDDDAARLLEIVPGFYGVSAPGSDETTILHYRRAGGTRFGFVAIDRHGAVDVLLERDGVGAGMLVDPFDAAVAVDEEGERVAISALHFGVAPESVAQTWIVGLGETELAGGVGSKTVNDQPLASVSGGSLAFIGKRLFGVRDATLVHAPRNGGSPFQVFPLPPSAGSTPTFVFPELTRAFEGDHFAVLAGAGEAALDLFVIDSNLMTATNLTNAPAWIQPPETTWATDVSGPQVAIDQDGHEVAYLVRDDYHDELYLGCTDAPGVKAHITKEPDFEPYIDNVTGVLTGGSRLVYIAASDHENRADVYRTDGTAGETILTTNLTATSGNVTPPFTEASQMLVSERWAIGDSLLLVDDRTDYGGGFDLWTIAGLENADHTTAGMSAPPRFSVPRHDGVAVVGVFSFATVQVVAMLGTDGDLDTPVPLLVLPHSWDIRAFAIDRDARRLLLAVELTPAEVFVGVIDLQGGAVAVTGGGPYPDVDEVRFGTSDNILFVRRDGAGLAHATRFNLITGVESTHGDGVIASWMK